MNLFTNISINNVSHLYILQGSCSYNKFPKKVSVKIILRTTALEKLVYISVTMNETSILHRAGGKVTLQARGAVNQSKKSANGKINNYCSLNSNRHNVYNF
jgi:hypothetical protein